MASCRVSGKVTKPMKIEKVTFNQSACQANDSAQCQSVVPVSISGCLGCQEGFAIGTMGVSMVAGFGVRSNPKFCDRKFPRISLSTPMVNPSLAHNPGGAPTPINQWVKTTDCALLLNKFDLS